MSYNRLSAGLIIEGINEGRGDIFMVAGVETTYASRSGGLVGCGTGYTTIMQRGKDVDREKSQLLRLFLASSGSEEDQTTECYRITEDLDRSDRRGEDDHRARDEENVLEDTGESEDQSTSGPDQEHSRDVE